MKITEVMNCAKGKEFIDEVSKHEEAGAPNLKSAFPRIGFLGTHRKQGGLGCGAR
jgi:hypothetical protein